MTTASTAWRERRVLITGSSGFVGGWLSRSLRESGAQVFGLSRGAVPANGGGAPDDTASFTPVPGTVSDLGSLEGVLRDCDVDTIFHLAGQSKVERALEHPIETFETNVQGAWNLLEAVRNTRRPIRIVMASTDMVYADSEVLPYTEKSAVAGSSPYGASKACAELLGQSYHRTFGVRVCIARTSNLYGGGDLGFQRIIPGTIRSVVLDQAPVIQSDGRPERDYLYVEDAVRGYMLLAEAMERPEICGETFNFSSGAPVSVLTIVRTILEIMGRQDLTPQVMASPTGRVSVRYASSSKATSLLGWSSSSPLESGLKKTIDWYRSHTTQLRMEVRN